MSRPGLLPETVENEVKIPSAETGVALPGALGQLQLLPSSSKSPGELTSLASSHPTELNLTYFKEQYCQFRAQKKHAPNL